MSAVMDYKNVFRLIVRQYESLIKPSEIPLTYQLLIDSISYLCQFYAQDDYQLQKQLQITFQSINHLPHELPSYYPEYLAQDIKYITKYWQLIKNQKVNTIFNPSSEFHFAFRTSHDELLPYRIYSPSGYAKNRTLPLMIGLHGAGYHENSSMKAFEFGGQNQLIAQAEKYQCLVASIYIGNHLPFYKNQPQNEQNMYDFLQHLKSIFGINEQGVFLLGHSMGCRGVWNLTIKYPTYFQGVAMVAGAASTSKNSKLNPFKTPLFYAYGGEDKVVKPHIAEGFWDGLKSKVSKLQIKHYESATHESILPMSIGDIFAFWMNSI